MTDSSLAKAGSIDIAPDPDNPVFGIETRGYEEVPLESRKMQIKDIYYLWAGTNANLIFVTFGALAIVLGLNFWTAIAAVLLGTLAYGYVGACSIGGARAGMPVVIFTRAPFGVRGNFPNAFLAWLISVGFETVNTVYGVFAFLALFEMLGWGDTGALGKIAAILIQLAIGAAIAFLGHATMIWTQRIFGVTLGITLLLVGIWVFPQTNWAQPFSAENSSSFAIIATIMVAAGIVASGPISYVYNAPDWVRYLSQKISNKQVFWHVTLAAGISSLFLSVIGVMMATLGNMTDPVGGLKPFIPGWLFVLYIIAAIGGSISNTAPTYYSSGLAIQAMGIPLHRHWATLLDSALATALVLYVFFVSDFLASLTNFLAFLVVWAGPYAGVWVMDGMMRKWKYNAASIQATEDRGGAHWRANGIDYWAWVALLAGMVVAVLTMHSPVFVGPIASAMGGADLAWFAGFFVSFVTYRIVTGGRVR
jgi:NCS1 family nucleobase:cation symporter-1